MTPQSFLCRFHVSLLFHNRQVSFQHLPRQRKLDDKEKQEAKGMLRLKANKKLIQSHLVQGTGKVVTLKDIHNLASEDRRKEAPVNDLQALVNEMKKSPGMYIIMMHISILSVNVWLLICNRMIM